MIRRLPIRVAAPLLVGLPVLAVGLALSLMWLAKSRSAVTELAERNIEQVHELAAARVGDLLAIPIRVTEVNAHLVRTGVLDPGDLAAWRPTLVRQARAFDMLSSIVWGDADGRATWVTRYADGTEYWAIKDDPAAPVMRQQRLGADGRPVEGSASTFAFDLFSRPWFAAPREAGRPAWSEPYVWVGGDGGESTLGLSYGIPVSAPDGTLLGVMDADLSFRDLSRYLAGLTIGRTGVAALVDAGGALLAVSTAARTVDAEGGRVSAAASEDPRFAAAAGALGEARAGHATVTVDGAPHLVRATLVGTDVGLQWTLVTVVPEADFVAGVRAEFARSAAASVAAVLAAVLVGMAAARWLVAPLSTLVDAVRRIGQGDLDTAVHVRHAPEYERLGSAINEMTAGLRDRMRMRESLSLAMEVQRNLLPSTTPASERVDLAGHSTYCDETGGDYYDFLDVSADAADEPMIAVGDVMGHGVAAAMLMATARGILRSRCAEPGSLADFLHHVNGMLVPDTGGERFMTMLLLRIEPERGAVRWASAGHGPPILFEAATGRVREIDGGGLPLGLVADADYEEHEVTGLAPDDLVIAATDGLWETQTADGELFGVERLHALLGRHVGRPAAEVSQAIRAALARHRGEAPPNDDLTFVIARMR